MEVFYQGAECDIHVQFVIKCAISSRSAEQNKGTFTNAQEGILFHDAKTVNLLMSLHMFLMSIFSLSVDVPVDANADDSATHARILNYSISGRGEHLHKTTVREGGCESHPIDTDPT